MRACVRLTTPVTGRGTLMAVCSRDTDGRVGSLDQLTPPGRYPFSRPLEHSRALGAVFNLLWLSSVEYVKRWVFSVIKDDER